MISSLKILIKWVGIEVLLYIGSLLSKAFDFSLGKILFLLVFWVTIPIGLFAWVYFGLAEDNLFFTFVKEGTAKVVVKGDQVIKILIQWKGYTLDEQWNVVKEGIPMKDGKKVPLGTPGAKIYKEKCHPLGGFRYYGFWPIKDIYIYGFTWTGIKEDGKIIHHEKEVLDYILLRRRLL